MNSSRKEALLYIFEDDEAVIKMIIKGRSPTMRHVSRTNRVALDWLFDRINLDPKIRIKYIDTKNQLADTPTKRNFTWDEWNHLLCLFNISHFSSIKHQKITPGSLPPWSWWRCPVPVISRPLWWTWQGSEELSRGHRCGWPQGSHWVWEGTPSPVQSGWSTITSVRARHVRLERRVVTLPTCSFLGAAM